MRPIKTYEVHGRTLALSADVGHLFRHTRSNRKNIKLSEVIRSGWTDRLIDEGVLVRLTRDDAKAVRAQGRRRTPAGAIALDVHKPFPEEALASSYDATDFFNQHPGGVVTSDVDDSNWSSMLDPVPEIDPPPFDDDADALPYRTPFMDPAQPTAELVTVPFDGNALQAVEQDGTIWVSVRRVCEAIGVAHQPQMLKLAERSWACVTQRVTRDTSGRTQQMTMVDLDTLGMWLATIDERRVSEAARPKVVRYQAECKKAIAAHFGLAKQPERPVGGQMMTTAQMLVAQAQLMVAFEARQDAFDSRLNHLEGQTVQIARLQGELSATKASLEGARKAYGDLRDFVAVHLKTQQVQAHVLDKQADTLRTRASLDERKERNRQRKSHRRRLRKLHKDIVALTGDYPGTTWHKIGLRANVHWDASQYPDGRPNESAIAYFERKDMLPQIIKEAEAWLAELQRGGGLALN